MVTGRALTLWLCVLGLGTASCAIAFPESAGSGGSGTAGGAPVCDQGTGACAACTSCAIDPGCAAASNACDTNANCGPLVLCVRDNGSAACNSSDPAAVELATAVRDCLCNSCQTDCAGAPLCS